MNIKFSNYMFFFFFQDAMKYKNCQLSLRVCLTERKSNSWFSISFSLIQVKAGTFSSESIRVVLNEIILFQVISFGFYIIFCK